MDTITDLDFAILRCIHDLNAPWKKRIHDTITQEDVYEPLVGDTSFQTVCKYVDDLLDDDLLNTTIIEPEKDVNKAYMIGFRLTDDGQDMLEKKRDELLRSIITDSAVPLITAGEDDFEAPRETLIALMEDEFSIGPEGSQLLHEAEDKDLILTLTVYYSRDNISDIFDRENAKTMAAIVLNTPEFLDVYRKVDVISHTMIQMRAQIQQQEKKDTETDLLTRTMTQLREEMEKE